VFGFQQVAYYTAATGRVVMDRADFCEREVEHGAGGWLTGVEQIVTAVGRVYSAGGCTFWKKHSVQLEIHVQIAFRVLVEQYKQVLVALRRSCAFYVTITV
jgi:hypothetical protein